MGVNRAITRRRVWQRATYRLRAWSDFRHRCHEGGFRMQFFSWLRQWKPREVDPDT
jgi:hypothetical protein